MTNLGEKIKTLRKSRNISQETLASYLGVSFQAVSKWETGATLPDVTLIPAIAAFFSVSTDELFDFKLYETERNIEKIVDEYSKCRGNGEKPENPEECEKLLRAGLKKYPGSDVLLNCLITVLPVPERADEVIETAKALTQAAKSDEVKLDAYRILAETYRETGDMSLAKEALTHIPEVYFTRLYCEACILNGEESFKAAAKERSLCLEHLVQMLGVMEAYYKEKGESKKALKMQKEALAVLKAFEGDFPTPWTYSLYNEEAVSRLEETVTCL